MTKPLVDEKSLTCQVCGGALSGKQRLYCSTRCNRAAFRVRNLERDREQSRAWKARNRERMRAYDAEYGHRPEIAGSCETCGGPLGSCGKLRGHKQCRTCLTAAAASRRQRIADLWADGATLREIAAATGSTPNSIGTEMARMRTDGWPLPRRYDWPPESLERIREANRAKVAA